MCPERNKQAGLGLPTAIFVITVMALLAVMINRLVESNAQSSGEEILLIRAFYAAESGAQIGLNGLFPPDGGAASCPAGPVSLGAFTASGLQGCTAAVSCSSQSVDGENYYTVQSTGSCGPVSRTIQVRAK